MSWVEEERILHIKVLSGRLERAMELLRGVEKRRNLFPSTCISCGKLPMGKLGGPGHATDCKLAQLLEEEAT